MACSLDDIGNNWRLWGDKAQDLVYAAETLKQHQERDREIWGELLLWGYALENFLKCLYLKRIGPLYRNGKLKWRKGKGHDLLKMAKGVRYSPTQAQSHMMERLTTVIKWAGRYPVGQRGQKPSVWWDEARDYPLLESLIESLRAEIDK